MINEVLANTPSNILDRVELYCSTNTLIIGGWFLSDTPDNYRKYMFPPNAVMFQQLPGD